MKTRTLVLTLGFAIMGVLGYIFWADGNVNSIPAKASLAPAAKTATTPPARQVELPSLPAVVPTTAPEPVSVTPATSASGDLTPAEKALLTRQALAAGNPAPKFSSALSEPPSPILTSLEERVVDMLPGAASSIHYDEIELFELEPGATSSYHMRNEVVKIPIPGAGSRLDSLDHVIYYLPSANHFYIVWEGMGAGTLHYHGPFEGNPYNIFGLPAPSRINPLH